ncbi:MAG TPA: helix-turn-helix domain-containing protein [Acidimicrobiales bacterium]|nr:helix-turn-helix domain-containing protein [Acidimicrobiales bacterium]
MTRPARERRTRRSEETRARVIGAAGRLFVERGYAATTIEAIADAADVSVETVYVRFRNKRNLLDAYLDVAIVGDTAAVPLLERPEVVAVSEEPDPRRRAELLAGVMAGVLERTAPVQRVIAGAAAVDPGLDDLLAQDDRRRRVTHTAFVDLLRGAAGLRDGITRKDAVDTLSALANPDTYRYLSTRRRFSRSRYERWLADAIVQLLLPAAPADRQPRGETRRRAIRPNATRCTGTSSFQ